MMSKKIPMRTCIGCGQVKEKKELIRIVVSEDGTVRTDPSARAAGRGAYLCRNPECVRRARKRRALGRAFRTGIAGGEYERLLGQIEALTENADEKPPAAASEVRQS